MFAHFPSNGAWGDDRPCGLNETKAFLGLNRAEIYFKDFWWRYVTRPNPPADRMEHDEYIGVYVADLILSPMNLKEKLTLHLTKSRILQATHESGSSHDAKRRGSRCYGSSRFISTFYNAPCNVHKLHSAFSFSASGIAGTTTSSSPLSCTSDSSPASCDSRNRECSSRRSLMRIRCSTLPRLQ